MNTNRKSNTVAHLTRLLDEGGWSDDDVRCLHKLGATGEPSAVPVIAGFLAVPGILGRSAARSLVRLSRSSSECLEAVEHTCELLVRTSIDSDEIRNARHVCEVIARRMPMLKAA